MRKIYWRDSIEETFGDQEFLRLIMRIEIEVDRILIRHPKFSGEKFVREMPGKEKLAFLARLTGDSDLASQYPHEMAEVTDFLKQVENGDLVAPKDYYDLPGGTPIGLLWQTGFRRVVLTILMIAVAITGVWATLYFLGHPWAWTGAFGAAIIIFFLYWIQQSVLILKEK